MLTSNYYKLKGYFEKHSNTQDSDSHTVDIGIKDTTGSSVSIVDIANNYATNVAYNYSMKTCLNPILGNAGFDPQLSDYNIRSPLNIPIEYTFLSTGEADKITTKFVITGTNNTGAGIRITEIGIAKRVCVMISKGSLYIPGDPTTSSDGCPLVLLDHTLLESPIQVENGNNFSVTFDWQEM